MSELFWGFLDSAGGGDGRDQDFDFVVLPGRQSVSQSVSQKGNITPRYTHAHTHTPLYIYTHTFHSVGPPRVVRDRVQGAVRFAFLGVISNELEGWMGGVMIQQTIKSVRLPSRKRITHRHTHTYTHTHTHTHTHTTGSWACAWTKSPCPCGSSV